MVNNNYKNLDLQVIIATMGQTDIEALLNKMNIQSSAIVTNQTNEFSKYDMSYNGNSIEVYNFDEKGVGLNRNNGFMRSIADIVVFADDDIRYVDGYEKIILSEFEKNPKADLIVFNISQNEEGKKRYRIKKDHRVHKYNCLRYGAVRMAVRTESIKKKNIFFSLLFGGGAKYGSGEDSIFIYTCIKSGLKVYASTKEILSIQESESTWFNGYNEKFFFDKGALLYCLFGPLSYIYIMLYILKHKEFLNDITRKQAIHYMIDGIKHAKIGVNYEERKN